MTPTTHILLTSSYKSFLTHSIFMVFMMVLSVYRYIMHIKYVGTIIMLKCIRVAKYYILS